MRSTHYEKTPERRKLAYIAALHKGKWAGYLEEDLTARQLQLLKLHYIEGMSKTDIAKQLGLSPSTVCRTIKRGEKRLSKVVRYL